MSPLAGGLITVAAAMAIGTLVLRRLNVAFTRLEFRLFALLAGSACLSGIVLLLASLQLARKGVFLALAGAALATAWRQRKAVRFEPPAAVPRGPAILFGVAALPFLALYLFTSVAPEVSPDGASYHLGNVLRYSAHHGLYPIRDLYGALPEGMEMLFLMAFSIGRNSAAAIVHLAFLAALPLLTIAFSLRFGFARAGFLAAILVFASPVIGKDGASAYIDVALAAVAFGVVYSVEIWRQSGDRRLLILAGLLAGFAFGIKYTGAVAAVYAAIRILPRNRRQLLYFAAPCALLVVPWLVKNAVYMHNPVSPFLNRLFPNPYVSARFEKDYAEAMKHLAGTSNPRELAVAYTVTGAPGLGFLGPLFLLAPLAFAALRHPVGRSLVLAAAVFAAPVVFNAETRFLIPAAPCLALGIGLGVAATRFAVPALIVLHAFASWPSIASAYCTRYAWRLDKAPVRAALGRSAQEYVQQNLGPGYDVARELERVTPPGSRVFCFNCPPQAYSTREISVAYESMEGNAMGDMLWTPMETGRQPLERMELSFPERMVRRLRVQLARTAADQVWRITEFRVQRGGVERTRSPRWRIHASPNPWAAPFAFDNSPVSKWSTEQYGARGAFLEVDFGEPVGADSVVLECPEGGPRDLQLMGSLGGEWFDLHVQVRVTAAAAPPGMRRAAVQMLENYGFHYLVVPGSDYYAGDYQKYPDYWGIRPIARAGDWTLYQLE